MTARTDHWAVWLTLILCVLAFVLGMWLMPGPSDTEAAADTALDLRDAQQQATRAPAPKPGWFGAEDDDAPF